MSEIVTLLNNPCGRRRSFNDREIDEQKVGPMGKELFEREQEDLLSDLKDIPRKACDRRVRRDIQFAFSSLTTSSIKL